MVADTLAVTVSKAAIADANVIGDADACGISATGVPAGVAVTMTIAVVIASFVVQAQYHVDPTVNQTKAPHKQQGSTRTPNAATQSPTAQSHSTLSAAALSDTRSRK